MPFGEGDVYTVAEINREVRALVESNYPDVAVLGEISNFKRHGSGHLYFSLKDAEASLSVVCFRSTARTLALDLQDGLKVVVRGRLTVYEGYGRYQLVANAVEGAGEGDLERAYRELLARLDAEGLFDAEGKKPLPRFPRVVAVVTSPTGAAVRDILSTLGRRWPCLDVLLAPVRVQGPQAAGEIAGALDMIGRARGVDVVIVGRGGGSLEDLWAFNEEVVARAIHRCPIPVISAVGHETDVTIADLVADVRAATPTMAAEIAVPLRDEVTARVDHLVARLERVVRTTLDLRARRLDELVRSYALGQVRGRIEAAMQRLDFALERARRATTALLERRSTQLAAATSRLRALDPRSILARGYTICTDPDTRRVIRGRDQAVAAQRMDVRFHDGAVRADVKEPL